MTCTFLVSHSLIVLAPGIFFFLLLGRCLASFDWCSLTLKGCFLDARQRLLIHGNANIFPGSTLITFHSPCTPTSMGFPKKKLIKYKLHSSTYASTGTNFIENFCESAKFFHQKSLLMNGCLQLHLSYYTFQIYIFGLKKQTNAGSSSLLLL